MHRRQHAVNAFSERAPVSTIVKRVLISTAPEAPSLNIEKPQDDHAVNFSTTSSPTYSPRGQVHVTMIEYMDKYVGGGGGDCQVNWMIISQVFWGLTR
jgi:hypothetical protein